MSEHTAKRQRLDSTGRFSPASPPFDVVAKAGGHTKTPIHPRTPTSPPYSSMSSQANGGSAMSSAAAHSDRSPPGSTAMSQTLSQSTASASIPYPFPTPASTTGQYSSATIDGDGDALMADNADDDEAAGPAQHRRSNHDREDIPEWSKKGGLKAAEGISGHELFKVASSRCEVSKPHASQNLFRLYSLEGLARSVARTDAVTGEKINKLRKSYEGHIKAMQIAGKPKAQKMEGVFSMPVWMPDEEWKVLKVQGKEMDKALNPAQTALDPGFGGLLDSAFAGMTSGSLPNADANRYRTYIGTDDVVKPKPQDGPPHRPSPHPSAAPTPGNSAVGRGVTRPERSGSKRHYTDAAFQGYGEGYNDDFGADSTGGEDNAQGNMAKRRKLQFERTSHSVEVGGARR
ncbi:Rox3 mediator complex subunit-domain-containing protein [Phaeosphaeria sp. MPI-PUGE-AT-0046c]|nr:Rox3 mediator complex subunit-domain-containing protein [Phaeosphaeria sp. MPI-PUGE-AT-0046c]